MMTEVSFFWSAVRNPLPTWEQAKTNFFGVLKGFALLAAVCTIMYFLTTLPNLEKIRLAAMSLSAKTGFAGSQSALPWNRLLLLPVWFSWIFLAAMIRFLTLRFLGDGEHAQLSSLSTIGMLGIAPLLVANTLLASVSNFTPVADLRALHPLTILSMVLLIAGILLEARITIPMFRAQTSQTRGRALLTWISPYALGMCFCSLPVGFLTLSMLR